MEFYNTHILTVVLFTPLVGALLLLFVPRDSENAHRVIGNLFAFLGLIVSLPLIWRFSLDPGAPRYQFYENHDWIPSIGAHYTLGIDGISLLLVILTTFLGAISILSSWSAIKIRRKEYYILFLLLQVGMLGVFMALDFFLFYMFWEVMLVPMYFLIGVWGSDRRPVRRDQIFPVHAGRFGDHAAGNSGAVFQSGRRHVRHSHAAGIGLAV